METQQGSAEAPLAPSYGAVDLTGDASINDPFLALPVEDLLQQVTNLFPDICPVHLNKLAEKFYVPESIIDAILQDLENGVSYPKRSVLGKRKRQTDPILESLAKSDGDFGESDVKRLNEYFMGPSWKERIAKIKGYRKLCVDYLASCVFRTASKAAVKRIFDQQRDASLFQLYWMMGQHGYREVTAFWEQPDRNWKPIEFDNPETEPAPDGDPANLCKEIYAARRIAAFKAREVLEGRKEAANRERAEADGTLRDCRCCFSDEPMNRMVCCDVNPEHTFCYACARKNAETQLGLSKYELKCLSMDDCPGNFHAAERKSYLDSKTIAALDRHEQDAALRDANIENLASCPFCPYAAVCPPVEEDKEFRCMDPECQVISCRLCNRETHVPRTCAEAAADNKNSARHQIEEAMSAAMIRKCNKCSTPFVKISGCNKMTCSKPGCRNKQCYICGKSCDYDHFSRAGCPLHDSTQNGVETLHRKEVEAAQETARKRLLEENPDMTEEELRIKLPGDPVTRKKKRAADARAPENPGAHTHANPPLEVYPLTGFMVAPLQPWNQPLQCGQDSFYQQEQGYPLEYQAGLYQLRQVLTQHEQPFQLRPAPAQTPEEYRLLLQGQAHDTLAAMYAPEDSGRAQIPLITNPPGAAAPEQPSSANYPAMPGGGTGPLSPVDEMMKEAVNEMSQAPSQHSLEIRLALLNSLKPYLDEIIKQVSNHIQAAWVGLMPPQIAAAMVRPILKETWKGVPRLVNGELEEIDRTVRNTNWEKLYDATAVVQGQLRHVGRIPPPETADEYVAMHAIVRCCDLQAPRHHAEMARQAHASVMATLGQQQPPPRVAPLHHYGSPGSQRLQIERIQKYLGTRRARVMNDRVLRITRNTPAVGSTAGATNGTAEGGGKLTLIAIPEIKGAVARPRSTSKPNPPVRPPGNTSGNGQGFAPQPLRRITGRSAQGATPAFTGSRDSPILIEDEDPGDGARNGKLSQPGALPYRVVGRLATTPRGGEPPTKRARA